jgi:hypothetical protein
MVLSAFRAGLREILTLGGARARVASYGEERLTALREEKRIARAKLVASRRLANPFAALDLLAIAADHTHNALALASIDGANATSIDFVSTFAQAEARRAELEAHVARALARIESRTPTELFGLRVGRFLAIATALLACGVAIARTRGDRDVALHKIVTVSSVHDGKPSALVDGHRRGTYGMQTNEGVHPFVMIDLGRAYRVRSVRVYNRGDGWFDEVLPLSLEVSIDGAHFREVAKRTEHFDVWNVDWSAAPVEARFIRASKANGYIALNEIEVYARE